MSILMLLLVLVVLGVVVWAITTYIPMTPGIARLIQIVAVIIALVYVLNAFGVLHALSGKPVPSLR